MKTKTDAKRKITAKEFDTKAEAGEDVSEYFDMESATKMVNIELPVWAIKALDKEATRRGVARQALMKMWLVDRLDALSGERKVS